MIHKDFLCHLTRIFMVNLLQHRIFLQKALRLVPYPNNRILHLAQLPDLGF